jgi:hypothetical protein
MTTSKSTTKTINTPTLVLVQWLSYVFWTLAIIAISYVASSVIAFYTDVSTTTFVEQVTYGVVAVVILLPLAIITDIFYGRHEDAHKSTATSVIHVIHSVLFALTAIGALITLAFLSVNSLIITTPSPTAVVEISTSAVVFVLFAGLFLRVNRPTMHRFMRKGFRIDLTVVTLVAIGFAIAGPVGYAVATKSDRQTRDSLNYVSNTLNSYVSVNDQLPDTLEAGLNDTEARMYGGNDDLRATALRLESEGTIKYTPNTKAPVTKDDDKSETTTTYFYELCGNFTHGLRKDSGYGVYPSYPVAEDTAVSSDYDSYIPSDEIKSGEVCYKLKATSYK